MNLYHIVKLFHVQVLYSSPPNRYIQGLESDSPLMSSCESSQTIRENQRSHPPKPILASDWLSPEAIQHSDSVVDALWALRDHMLQDSVKLTRYLDSIQ